MINVEYINDYDEIKALQRSNSQNKNMDNKDITNSVSVILENVRSKGLDAVKKYNSKFDNTIKIDCYYPDDFKKAYELIDDRFKKILTVSAQNIRNFHIHQLKNEEIALNFDDYSLGELTVPLNRVAVYVPGGTASYPSTVLMCVIPAKIAGVKKVIIYTPARKTQDFNLDILAAAHVAHADEIIMVGGVHGLGLAAYGAGDFEPVDKIVGPGNIYVATAKKLLYGVCDIDMIAGPSEIVIIADDSANPSFIASDMISQAEHDVRAVAILITTSKAICGSTIQELEQQIKQLSRNTIITESLTSNSRIFVCKTHELALSLANAIAPEHLELQTENPEQDLKKIHNAGSVFLGNFTPEPVGDYHAGLNHVLPTSGTARFFSPLSVASFTKTIQYAYYSKKKLKESADDIIGFAEREGFSGHANSIKTRLEQSNSNKNLDKN
ncbi:MAG: histidinol dehydrogenase [Christensenellaceae bacterium]|jgi:histidinol dehydrogenase|nr:histidinol dehydrogenase [Christensenellaceae bacterium]